MHAEHSTAVLGAGKPDGVIGTATGRTAAAINRIVERPVRYIPSRGGTRIVPCDLRCRAGRTQVIVLQRSAAGLRFQVSRTSAVTRRAIRHTR